VNCKPRPITILWRIAVLTALGCASVTAADTSAYEQTVAYIQEKSISKDIRPNEYYDSTKESENYANVKTEIFRKIQFPDNCVLEIVNERFEEVAPPSNSDSENNYGFVERETLTVKLKAVIPSQIYSSKRPPDGTVVILKSRADGIVSKTEKFYDQPGNKNFYGVTMQAAAKNSIDSPFGKLECADETCTRSRGLNGYGITPSEKNTLMVCETRLSVL